MGKDANAPKKPLIGYFKFLVAKRDQIKKENPDLSHKELTTKCGASWRGLSEEEKTEWKADKGGLMVEYKKKMAAYKKTDNYKNFRSSLAAKKSKLTMKRFKKDKNAPKRPTGSYFLFCNEIRKEVTEALPEALRKKISEAAKEMGKRWAALGDEKKQSYKDQSAKLKVVYDEELKEYKKSDEHAEYEAAKKAYQAKQKSAKKVVKKAPKKSTKKSKKKATKKRTLPDSDTEEDSSDSDSSSSSS